MPFIIRWISALPLACAVVALAAAPARAQLLPSRPIEFADGRGTVGADVSASFSCSPEPTGCNSEELGFFNYTDYEHSALRLFRLALTGSLTVNRHLSLLAGG